MRSYKIVEIFRSIQGEGYHSGRSAIFVRFYGCNLSCTFCDEAEELTYKEYEEQNLFKELRRYKPCKFVVLTGGEPGIQENLRYVVEGLQKLGYYVSVETNGTRDLGCSPDWITVSPKTEEFIKGDEIKVLYKGQDLERYEGEGFKHFYLQPINDRKEINYKSLRECIKAVERNPKWHLSVQLHKALKIP